MPLDSHYSPYDLCPDVAKIHQAVSQFQVNALYHKLALDMQHAESSQLLVWAATIDDLQDRALEMGEGWRDMVYDMLYPHDMLWREVQAIREAVSADLERFSAVVLQNEPDTPLKKELQGIRDAVVRFQAGFEACLSRNDISKPDGLTAPCAPAPQIMTPQTDNVVPFPLYRRKS